MLLIYFIFARRRFEVETRTAAAVREGRMKRQQKNILQNQCVLLLSEHEFCSFVVVVGGGGKENLVSSVAL